MVKKERRLNIMGYLFKRGMKVKLIRNTTKNKALEKYLNIEGKVKDYEIYVGKRTYIVNFPDGKSLLVYEDDLERAKEPSIKKSFSETDFNINDEVVLISSNGIRGNIENRIRTLATITDKEGNFYKIRFYDGFHIVVRAKNIVKDESISFLTFEDMEELINFAIDTTDKEYFEELAHRRCEMLK
ncbi:hypothetical protein [Bacillus sp. JJ722]|uniref:hypothetical protein n=1 Tax=Bacillus sp. JJ722 TaxID=3122973 RepID=UPI002FFDA8AE